MRDKLIRFMMGRYGMDNLNNCLLWSSLVLLIIATFTRLGLLTLISYVLMIIVIYRMLSRKIYQRENENKIYLCNRRSYFRIRERINSCGFRKKFNHGRIYCNCY